jgi:hypothetical protein
MLAGRYSKSTRSSTGGLLNIWEDYALLDTLTHIRREASLRLAEALGCDAAALRRDAFDDWHIRGHHDHLFAEKGGALIFIRARNGRASRWRWPSVRLPITTR